MRKLLFTLYTLLAACFFLYAGDGADAAHFLRAVVNYVEGRNEAAHKILADLKETSPDDDAVNYYLALTAYELGKVDEAEDCLNTAIQLDSTNRWYLESLGTLYRNKGDRSGFAVICEKLYELYPSQYNSPYTHCVLGDEMLNRRLPDIALDHYNKALELDPEYAPAQLGKLELYRLRGESVPFFLTLGDFVRNDIVRGDIKCEYLSAVMENMDGRTYRMWGKELRSFIDHCYKESPAEPTANMLKIQIHLIENEMDSLLTVCGKFAEYSKAAGDTANLVLAWNITADVYHEQGKESVTFEIYERILKLNPDYAPVLNNYAYYLSEKGKKLRKALKMSRRTVELEPDNATYLDTYGWILYLLKRPEEAKPYFKRAMIYGGKDSSVILEHYSKVLEALGENELAIYYANLAEQKRNSGR